MDQHCPSSTAAGCRCTQHHPGLLAYARDVNGLAHALDNLVPVKLHVLTRERPEGCDGTMTCECEACARDRVTRAATTIRQPWEPRPARHAA